MTGVRYMVDIAVERFESEWYSGFSTRLGG